MYSLRPRFPNWGREPKKGVAAQNVGVAHQSGGRWGRAAPRRVANEHLEDALMLAITTRLVVKTMRKMELENQCMAL